MTINQRIRLIRKTLGLTQNDFGMPIKLKQNTVSDLERNHHPVTDKNITLICREYNIDENWLRTGEGEMFCSKDNISFDDYAERKNLSSQEKKLFLKFLDLDNRTREQFLDYIKAALAIRETAIQEVAEKKFTKNKSTLTKKQSSEEEQLKIKLVARGAATLVGTRAEIIKALEEDLDRDDNDDYDAY